jgi:hypothetical protein
VSGGTMWRAGHIARPSSTDIPGWRPSADASGETSRINARGVWTGATATGRFRRAEFCARASAISKEGMYKQAICRSIVQSLVCIQWLQTHNSKSTPKKPYLHQPLRCVTFHPSQRSNAAPTPRSGYVPGPLSRRIPHGALRVSIHYSSVHLR